MKKTGKKFQLKSNNKRDKVMKNMDFNEPAI